jgi:Domain of Unknown Function (DUF928)
VGAGNRGPCFVHQERGINDVIAIVPSEVPVLTASATPTLYWYLPPTVTPPLGEVELLNAEGKTLSKSNLTLPKQPGIIQYQLRAADTQLMEIGETYTVRFSAICPTVDDSSGIASVETLLQRIEPSAALAQELQAAQPSQKANIYAAYGIWENASATIAPLRRQGDRQALTNWKLLLESVGLGDLGTAPLLECCQDSLAKPR